MFELSILVFRYLSRFIGQECWTRFGICSMVCVISKITGFTVNTSYAAPFTLPRVMSIPTAGTGGRISTIEASVPKPLAFEAALYIYIFVDSNSIEIMHYFLNF